MNFIIPNGVIIFTTYSSCYYIFVLVSLFILFFANNVFLCNFKRAYNKFLPIPLRLFLYFILFHIPFLAFIISYFLYQKGEKFKQMFAKGCFIVGFFSTLFFSLALLGK